MGLVCIWSLKDLSEFGLNIALKYPFPVLSYQLCIEIDVKTGFSFECRLTISTRYLVSEL